MRIALVVAAVLLLGGCAVEPAVTTSPTPDTTPSSTPTPTPTPAGPIADDPASYPDDNPSFTGVQFTVADGLTQCAIFDPTGTDLYPTPFFGCVTSAPDFPYPPLAEPGPLDSANAFVSEGHQPGLPTTVTDATLSGDTAKPALPAGHSLTWSTVTCLALTDSEVRCTDSPSGHGIRISLTDWEVF